jgi:hypothetical protein
MNRIAIAVLAALLVPALGLAQTVTGGYGYYPGNTYPSGNVVNGSYTYPTGTVNQGYNYPGTVNSGYNYPTGQVGSVGSSVNGQLYNPYEDPRYSQQFGNRYYDNTYLNGGLSPAVVPAVMGAVVGAVLGSHFGITGIVIGGVAGFVIGNAIWQHFTGQSIFDYLFYGNLFRTPYAYGNQYSPYTGYGQYPGGQSGYGYPTNGYTQYGYPANNYGYGYATGAATNPYYSNSLTVGASLLKAPAAPSDSIETLRKAYFDAVNVYQNALKDGKGADEARASMESTRAAYQNALSAAAGSSK